MTEVEPAYQSLDDWIARNAIRLSMTSPDGFDALNTMIDSLESSVELLGFGEALHGGEEILMLRNRLFRFLVETHGYCAIAIESSFSSARLVNDFVAGRGPSSYDEIKETGFGHGFGWLEANRELVEWMRRYNGNQSHAAKLRFYGFDIHTGATGIATPRHDLQIALDYLESIDARLGREYRKRIDSLLAPDSDWENTEASADRAEAVALSPNANALRIQTENLITELRVLRPELVAKSTPEQYLEALQSALGTREVLNVHAALAQKSNDPPEARLLSIRDAFMADNLMYILDRERTRGKVFAFAHNAHLQRGKASFRWYTWWPAGSHLNEMLGSRYAVIASAVGTSEANGIEAPEAGTLEARLTARGLVSFVPTYNGKRLPRSEIASLPTRSGGKTNLSYSPLDARSFSNFDWLAIFDSTEYSRGGRPLPEQG